MRATRLALVAILVIGCMGVPGETTRPTGQLTPVATGQSPTSTPDINATDGPSLPTPAITITPAPTAPPSAPPSAPLEATPTPAITPTAALTPSPPANPQAIATGLYLQSQLVLDASGAAHVIAASDRRGGIIFYFTNKGGAWTRERISGTDALPSESDVGFSITTDADGSVWFAFEGGDGIYVQSPDSAATKFIDDPLTRNPSLVVRDGRIHLAYEAYPGGGSAPLGIVRYATDATGELTDEEVGRGDHASLQVAADGTPLVLYHDMEVGVPLQFAIGATTTGSFSIETGPQSGDIDIDSEPQLVIDGSGAIHATWLGRASTDFEPPSTVFYSRFDGGWSEPENVGDLGEDVYAYGMAVDDSGAIHVVADFGSPRVSVYATNSGGAFASQPLPAGDLVTSNSAIAVDDVAEPHFVYEQYMVEPDDNGEPVASGFELLYRVGIGD